MKKFVSYGVMHFNIECDQFVGARERYVTAQEFLNAAMSEDAGYELADELSWNEAETFNNLFPFVHGNAFITHRCGGCPDPDINEWWTFVDGPGKGHIKVWVLDMEDVRGKYRPKKGLDI